MKDMMSYMNVLNNAAVSLKRLGFPEDQIASSIWNSVKSTVPNHLADYCRRKVPRFDEDYGSDVSTWHSICGLKKFDGFYAYILAYSITEASIRPDKPVLKVEVDEKTSPAKSEDKIVCQAQAAPEETPSAASGSGGDEPPAKKPRVDGQQSGVRKTKTKITIGLLRKRCVSYVNHLSITGVTASCRLTAEKLSI
jgi:hypothetical protein